MLACAAALLLLAAILHFADYAEADRLITHASMAETWRDALRGAWILYASHLVIIAAVCAYACSRPGVVAAPLLILCGLVPALDAIVSLFFLAGFVPPMLLGFAAVLIFGAVARGTMTLVDGVPDPTAGRSSR
ncbi:MAG: hypothetical protein HC872_03645 [Gammaproteobacteria bacterium]|nr:hypothetical protein [Gammaproteobacteria bacterium]